MENYWLTILILLVLGVYVAYMYGPWAWIRVETAHAAVKIVNEKVTGEWYGSGLMHVRPGFDEYKIVPIGEVQFTVSLPALRSSQSVQSGTGEVKMASVDLLFELTAQIQVEDPCALVVSLLAEMGSAAGDDHKQLSMRIFNDRVNILMKAAANTALDSMDYDEIKGKGGTKRFEELLNQAFLATGTFKRWGVAVRMPWKMSDVSPSQGVRLAEEALFAAQLRAEGEERGADAAKYVTEQEAKGEAAALREFPDPKQGIELRKWDAIRSLSNLTTLIVDGAQDLGTKASLALFGGLPKNPPTGGRRS